MSTRGVQPPRGGGGGGGFARRDGRDHPLCPRAAAAAASAAASVPTRWVAAEMAVSIATPTAGAVALLPPPF